MTYCRRCAAHLPEDQYARCDACRDSEMCYTCWRFDSTCYSWLYARILNGGQCNACAHELMEGP